MTSGILRGIEDGWFMAEIAEAAFQYQVALEKGEKKIVGVNCHPHSVTHDLEILRVSHEVETVQVAELSRATRRAGRGRSGGGAGAMVDVSRPTQNMMPAMLEAVRAEATLGEICAALKLEWGEYSEPAGSDRSVFSDSAGRWVLAARDFLGWAHDGSAVLPTRRGRPLRLACTNPARAAACWLAAVARTRSTSWASRRCAPTWSSAACRSSCW